MATNTSAPRTRVGTNFNVRPGRVPTDQILNLEQTQEGAIIYDTTTRNFKYSNGERFVDIATVDNFYSVVSFASPLDLSTLTVGSTYSIDVSTTRPEVPLQWAQGDRAIIEFDRSNYFSGLVTDYVSIDGGLSGTLSITIDNVVGSQSNIGVVVVDEFLHVGVDSGTNINVVGSYQNYDALVAALPTEDIGTLAYVVEAQGNQFLPGNWGGNYFPRGYYVFVADTDTTQAGDQPGWRSDKGLISRGLSQVIGNEIQSGSIVNDDTIRLLKQDGTNVDITGLDTTINNLITVKADTDLQNISTTLTTEQQETIRTRIGVVSQEELTTERDARVTGDSNLAKTIATNTTAISNIINSLPVTFTNAATDATVNGFLSEWDAGNAQDTTPRPTNLSVISDGDNIAVADTTTGLTRIYKYNDNGDGDFAYGGNAGFTGSDFVLVNTLHTPGTGSGGGLLPTDYLYIFNGGNASGFLQAWDSGLGLITTSTGVTVTSGTLTTGDTVTIGDSDSGLTTIQRWDGGSFIYGADVGGENPDDMVLLYTFSDAESIARENGDRLAEQHINGLTFDTIASQTGIHLDGTGPAGTELIKVSGEDALEASVQEIYFTPSSNTLTYVFLPDTATLSGGVWSLVDGGNTIADLPDSEGHPLVAAYGSITSPDNDTSTFFAGSVLRAHWNGRQFYWVLSITDGVSDIEGIADAGDTFGDRDITGIADTTMVLRNVFSIGATHASGFLNRSPQGVFSFEDIGRATLLGVTQSDYTAGTIQAAFAASPQSPTGVFVDTRDNEYLVNGFTVRNSEFYATTATLFRFSILVDQGVDEPFSISSTLWFDAIVETVVQEENGVRLTVTITDLSDDLAARPATDSFAGHGWLIELGNGVAALANTKAAAIPVIHQSHIPRVSFTDNEALDPQVQFVTVQAQTVSSGNDALLLNPQDGETSNLNLLIGSTFNINSTEHVVTELGISTNQVIFTPTYTGDDVSYAANARLIFTSRTPTFTAPLVYTGMVESNDTGARVVNKDFVDRSIAAIDLDDSRFTTPTGATYLRGNATDGDWDNITGATLYSDIVPSHPVTNVTSNIPVDNTTIVETPATPYEIGYTLGETIQSGHVELYGQNVQTLTDLAAGGHTLEITLTQQQAFNACLLYTSPSPRDS